MLIISRMLDKGYIIGAKVVICMSVANYLLLPFHARLAQLLNRRCICTATIVIFCVTQKAIRQLSIYGRVTGTLAAICASRYARAEGSSLRRARFTLQILVTPVLLHKSRLERLRYAARPRAAVILVAKCRNSNHRSAVMRASCIFTSS